MYLTGVGYGMIGAGIQINTNIPEVDIDIPDYANLLFAGGFLTTLFWV